MIRHAAARVLGGAAMLLGLVASLDAQALPPLPDPSGFGTHVLAAAAAPGGAVWVGTYGEGIYVYRAGGTWEHLVSDTTGRSISWDFVHAFAFGPRGEIWYGTVGNGWGLSTDGGRTWKNWAFRDLGPEWQYVAPHGIVTRGDTVYIATADGLKLTWDDGATWHVVTDSFGVKTAADPVWGVIANQYVLALGLTADGAIELSEVHGVERSRDGGRHWEIVSRTRGLPKVRAVGLPRDTTLLRVVRDLPGARGPVLASVPAGPAATPPAPLRHTWFRRPIALADQPYIDQTYRYGSTMGGNFQQHQGVEFNNGDGTPVHAIGDGVVVWAGPAEAGAKTVAIRQDRHLVANDTSYFIFSVYYHNSRLMVHVGERVRAGQVISLVGNTGRATNDHLHLEVHAAPVDSVHLIVDPNERYPRFTTNPELWIQPLPGTGVVAGQVWDSAGRAVPGARIYGLGKSEPNETPFSYAETYREHNRGTPVYHEHFAVGDVPAGRYELMTEVDGRRIVRRVTVVAGRVTWVEFRP
ncbi:MAG TPA: peptidoglycan DD-metalloendopeptidase family protein [Gemmatimonadales bacterium]|nr:peptidoglycan DD-metalloendopeptidase family protein [Gemmatimonadales bacterium]